MGKHGIAMSIRRFKIPTDKQADSIPVLSKCQDQFDHTCWQEAGRVGRSAELQMQSSGYWDPVGSLHKCQTIWRSKEGSLVQYHHQYLAPLLLETSLTYINI